MKITNVKIHSLNDLIKKLKQVTVKCDPNFQIYKDCEFSYRCTNNVACDIFPAQKYICLDELEKVRNLYFELLNKYNIDIFDLNGYITIKTEDFNDEIDVLPPIVEYTRMPNGLHYNLLNDGMHRIYLAKLEYRPVSTVIISGVPEEYPYYAFPIAHAPGNPSIADWSLVKEFKTSSDIPSNYIKRWPRIPNHKLLYRNFNSVFSHVSGRHTNKSAIG